MASLRQAPDVILLGEMRDFDTIKTAMTAAETGHLVISTLHTIGSANSIDRIIDVFPPDGQQQIRVQLAMVLQAVISQQLVPTVTGGMVPAFEIMFLNDAIRTMVREGKIHQIDNVIATSMAEGMISMNNSCLLYTSWVDNIIYFDGTDWKLMDPTFVSSGKKSAEVLNYVSNPANYRQKFCY